MDPRLVATIGLIVGAYVAAQNRRARLAPDFPEDSPTWAPPAAAAPYRMHFEAAEDAFGLPRHLLARVAKQESNYNPNAVSPAGAQGIMQIVPKWHPNARPFSPVHSIWYAAAYLRELHDQFGTWNLALAAYNWGPGNLSKRGLAAAPDETRNYVRDISHDLRIA